MDTKQIGTKLVELCRQNGNIEAVNTLYDADIVSVEVMGNEAMPKVTNGIDAVRKKNQWWVENHEVHAAGAEGPYPHDDRFAVKFHYEVTPKSGPMQGKRMNMDEVAIYTVANGKIVKEEFFYDMS